MDKNNGTNNNRLKVAIGTVAGIALLLGAFLVVWLIPRGPDVGNAKVETSNTSTGTQSKDNAPARSVDMAGSNQPVVGYVNGAAVSDQPHITVHGTGIISAKPDIANLQVGVQIQNTSLDAAQTDAATKMDAITTEIKAAGVDEKDITTSQYNVEPVMNYQDNQPPEVTGFRVTNIVNVKLRDISKASKLVDALVKSGANTIYGISFGFSDPTALMKQAREAAVNDAKDKAAQLATLTGVTLGTPLSVEDGGSNTPPVLMDSAANAGGVAGKSMPASTPVNPGQQEIRVELDIVYGIK